MVINRTNHRKILGVMVDQHFTFEANVRFILGKISRGIAILYKAKIMLQEPTLLILYYPFLFPYFTYCITLWGNTYPTVLDPLVKGQKRAIRFVRRPSKCDHTYPVFQSLKFLTWENYGCIRYKYFSINIANKTFHRYSLMFYCCQHDPCTLYSAK